MTLILKDLDEKNPLNFQPNSEISQLNQKILNISNNSSFFNDKKIGLGEKRHQLPRSRQKKRPIAKERSEGQPHRYEFLQEDI
jgi:hypothetical protein